MYTRVFTLIAGTLLFSPSIAASSVVISEFLYDAEGTDTGKEFVELHNNGTEAVDLTKWKIFDGSNHPLNAPPANGGTGSITISPGEYTVLVNDASVFASAHPSLTASIIDTVLSLPNTSGTISLLNEAGATVDTVSYTKDLGANGNGLSLHRNGSSLVAKTPTPGAQSGETSGNEQSTVEEESNDDTETVATSTVQTSVSQQSTYVAPPATSLFADGGDDRTVIVGADTDFFGRAYNRKQEIIDQVRFAWNFGDGTTAEGAALSHYYEYPGRYAVVLTIAQNRSAASDFIIVTAEPAKLGFLVNSDGSISIENHAGRDLNLSRWSIKSYSRIFVLPEDSVVLKGESLRLSAKTVGFPVGQQTELLYPNGLRALIAGERATETAVVPPAIEQKVISTLQPKPKTKSAPKKKPVIKVKTADADPVEETAEALVATSNQLASAGMSAGYWWLGAIGFAGVAFAGAAAAKRYRSREWKIIEQNDEGV